MWEGAGNDPLWSDEEPEKKPVGTKKEGPPKATPALPVPEKTIGGIGFGSVSRPRRRGGGGWFNPGLSE